MWVQLFIPQCSSHRFCGPKVGSCHHYWVPTVTVWASCWQNQEEARFTPHHCQTHLSSLPPFSSSASTRGGIGELSVLTGRQLWVSSSSFWSKSKWLATRQHSKEKITISVAESIAKSISDCQRREGKGVVLIEMPAAVSITHQTGYLRSVFRKLPKVNIIELHV